MSTPPEALFSARGASWCAVIARESHLVQAGVDGTWSGSCGGNSVEVVISGAKAGQHLSLLIERGHPVAVMGAVVIAQHLDSLWCLPASLSIFCFQTWWLGPPTRRAAQVTRPCTCVDLEPTSLWSDLVVLSLLSLYIQIRVLPRTAFGRWQKLHHPALLSSCLGPRVWVVLLSVGIIWSHHP